MKKNILTVLPVYLVFLFLVVFILSGCGNQTEGKIGATGTVEMTEVTVGSKTGGKVVRIYVEEGRKVKAGDLLAELDHEELDAQIAAASANLEVAQARFDGSQSVLASKGTNAGDTGPGSDTRQAQIQAAQSNLEAAKAGLEFAQKDFDRMKELYTEQLIPASQYEQAETRLKTARAQYNTATSQLDLVKASPNQDDAILSNRQYEALLKQAKANLVLLTTQLKNTKIYAPSSGIISGQLIEEGEIVSPGMSLFTLLDDKKPWVRIYLPLLEVEKVALGQKSYVQMDVSAQKYYGKITFISQEAEFTPKDYQTKEERVKKVYAVKIEMDNKTGQLKAGMPVDVWIE